MSRRSQRRRDGRATLDLLEEAVHLIRTAPAGVLSAYLVGSIPFVLAFLYFWSDMSRSAFAVERCAPLAGGLALLFVWMKFWHVVFARWLRERISGAPLPRIPFAEWVNLTGAQTFWQATGLLLLPLALIVVFPAGWVVAFYQNLTALGAVGTEAARKPLRKALRHTRLWPGQNHAALATLSGIGLVVFVNVMILLLAIPFLMKTLFGVETTFSQSNWAMANSTFVAAAAAITWLALDPVAKAFYALRCFHGDALTTGDDIRVELRQFTGGRRTATAALVMCLLVAGAIPAWCADGEGPATGEPPSRSPAAESAESSTELDQAIDDVLQRREYAWRMPREEVVAGTAGTGWLQRNLDRVLDWMGRQIRAVGRSVAEFLRWVADKLFGNRSRPPMSSGVGWENAVRGMFILLIILLVAALAYLGYRLWKHYRPAPVVEAAAAPPPDLTDDSLTAAQLPEDEWLRLAREMIAKGELRLAVRAFYLAGLAHLAGRGLVTIARHKSNREYERELGRRAHALPEVVGAFAEHVNTFDRVWYGDHPPTPELLTAVETNLGRIAAA